MSDTISLADITTQILTNASVLFPIARDAKVVSVQNKAFGIICHALVFRKFDPVSGREVYSILLEGAGEVDRRASMLALLAETEGMIAKLLFTEEELGDS